MIITKIEPNGGDTLFKITGSGFGATQATYQGAVSVSNSSLARSFATISTWSDTQITGTLPSDKKLPSGTLFVILKLVDGNQTLHSLPTNSCTYSIS